MHVSELPLNLVNVLYDDLVFKGPNNYFKFAFHHPYCEWKSNEGLWKVFPKGYLLDLPIGSLMSNLACLSPQLLPNLKVLDSVLLDF